MYSENATKFDKSPSVVGICGIYFPLNYLVYIFLDADEGTEKFKAGMHKQETFKNYLTFLNML